MKSFVPLLRAEWRLLLFGFVMTFGSSLGQTYFIGLFSGEIRSDLALTHGEFGGIYSAATLLSAVILLWSGSLIDRLALPRFAYGVVAGLALGCVLLAVSHGAVMLFISVLFLRHLGQGLMSMAGATTMVRYLDKNKGKANAVSGIGYSLSEAVLPSLVIAILAVFTWREAWILCAAVLIVIMPLLINRLLLGHDARHALYIRSVDQAAPPGEGISRRQWTRDEVIRDPLFYLFMPAMLAQPMLFTGFMFHQVHLVQTKGWDLAVWGSLYLLYAAVSAAFKLWAGILVDRFGAIKLVPFTCLPLGIGLLILSGSDDMVVAALFMLLMGISIGVYSTLSSPFFSEMYGTLHLGSIKSVTTAAMVFASAVAPVLMGWLIDRGVSMEAMALAGALYVVIACALAWLALRRAVRRDCIS